MPLQLWGGISKSVFLQAFFLVQNQRRVDEETGHQGAVQIPAIAHRTTDQKKCFYCFMANQGAFVIALHVPAHVDYELDLLTIVTTRQSDPRIVLPLLKLFRIHRRFLNRPKGPLPGFRRSASASSVKCRDRLDVESRGSRGASTKSGRYI
jgi:hypothetical protein